YVAPRTGESEIGRNSWTFINNIFAYYRAVVINPEQFKKEDRKTVAEKTFELAQWGQLSETAAALPQMSMRTSSGKDALAALVREHQDLANEWRTLDAQSIRLLSIEPADKQRPSAEVVKKRLPEIETRLIEVGRELQKRFPDYTELSTPQAVPANELQLLLKPEEVLVHYALTESDCFVWAITRDDVHWIRLEIDGRKLIDLVVALRQQLSVNRFNFNVAYEVYQAIFGPIEAQLYGKHIFIVPSGVLTTL